MPTINRRPKPAASAVTTATDHPSDDCYAWMSIGAYAFGLRPYLLHLQPDVPIAPTPSAASHRPATAGHRRHVARLSCVGFAMYVFPVAGICVALLLFNLTGYFSGLSDRSLSLRYSSVVSRMQSTFVRGANLLLLGEVFARRLFGQRRARRQADLMHALDRRLAACERTAAERQRSARSLGAMRWRGPLHLGMHVALALMSLSLWYFSVQAARSFKWMLMRVFLVIYPQLMRQLAMVSMAYQLGVLRRRMVWLNGVLERRLLVAEADEGAAEAGDDDEGVD